ncbi:hypothetical protein RM844_24620 [Streptomyces sp. DSM 44915]|uniref:Uncharacterized protein n=1 Tax=Streptomyces chisholmiae TaxID=3075540 RepID=A0ABU2JWU1_9ACTN|nr:hypothetical protein [Streptomyces sp. DSM 44915]MDT0269471.1 hypothetical protein [Streptomyces sp. DSM 44915]
MRIQARGNALANDRFKLRQFVLYSLFGTVPLALAGAGTAFAAAPGPEWSVRSADQGSTAVGADHGPVVGVFGATDDDLDPDVHDWG